MKGVINKGIQELVEEKFGLEAWEEVKRRAGCHEPFFATHREYPDEMTADLVEAAAGALGLIEGVCTLFDEELSVREISCALEGDPRCTMEVSFP